jgi:hypothetical protein
MSFPVEGGCDCRYIRYQLTSAPLFVNCCHCRWCQRETGSAFVLNANIEADRVVLVAGEPQMIETPTQSGYAQIIARCPKCWVAVWSHYASAGPVTRFVRVGTLDDPDLFPPQAHVFVASKQPWVVLSPGVPQFTGFYELEEVWSRESLVRRRALLPQIQAWQQARQKKVGG